MLTYFLFYYSLMFCLFPKHAVDDAYRLDFERTSMFSNSNHIALLYEWAESAPSWVSTI